MPFISLTFFNYQQKNFIAAMLVPLVTSIFFRKSHFDTIFFEIVIVIIIAWILNLDLGLLKLIYEKLTI